MLLVCFIWGANYSITKTALARIDPIPFAALRYLVACALLLAVTQVLEPGTSVPRGSRAALALLGVVGNTLNQIAFLSGLKLTTATNASLIFATLPVVVAFLGTGLGVEVPGPRVRWGIVLGTLGVALVVGARGLSFSSATFRGDLLNLLAVLCWAIFTVGLRHLGQGISALRLTTFTTLAGTPGLVLAALPTLGSVPWRSLGAPVWGALLYSAVFASVVALILWNRSVQAMGGSRTALFNCVTPIIAGLIAWVVLGERPLPLQGLGALLVIGGVLVSQGVVRVGRRVTA